MNIFYNACRARSTFLNPNCRKNREDAKIAEKFGGLRHRRGFSILNAGFVSYKLSKNGFRLSNFKSCRIDAFTAITKLYD